MDASAPTTHLGLDELIAGLPRILEAPRDRGTLELVLRRPGEDLREVLDRAELTFAEGVRGDNWNRRSSTRTEDGSPHPEMQLNVMSARVVDLVARSRDRWSLAGDQLYLDLDLSEDNLPAGTRLSIGSAVIEVTPEPHRGCAKFTRRFGADARRFVNLPEHRHLRLRGLNAKVVVEGTVRPGDQVTKV
ncbi:MAG: MOSC domain-containing protein [Acidimicrobiales bacterium]